MAEKKTARELIEQGLRDTERLISQKNYNLAMIKARQTLEYMVKSQCRKKGIPDNDLLNMIDDLFRAGVISRDTCSRYHKIRILGNKAVHDNDNNAYNANNSYQLLSQEVYAYRQKSAKRSGTKSQKSSQSHSSAAVMSSSQRKPARRSSFSIFKILIPVLAVILVICIVRLLLGVKSASPKETTAVETMAETSAELQETSAAAETEAAPVMIYTTTASVNVRSAPNTNGKLLATLPAGTVVDYVSAYDNEWAIVTYDNAEAYIASRYLKAEEQPAAQ